jgi:HSP20 family protein
MAQQDKRQEEKRQQDDAPRGRQGETTSPTSLQRRGERGGLAPWRSGTPFDRMMSEMDWWFDQMQRRFFGAPMFESMMPWRGEGGAGFGRWPHLDIDDSGDTVVIHAEIPGVDPKDVQIECRDDMLTIRAEHREEEGDESGRARRHASFYRQVMLPSDVDVDRGEASHRNGVLTVKFPKRADANNVKRIPINAESPGSAGARREAA